MSKEEDYLIEVANHIREKEKVTVDMGKSEGFQEFMRELEAQAEKGENLTNIVATAVMTLFEPGFVLIGSPYMEKTEDGIMVPEDVGVCLSASTELTPTNLAYLLRRLADAIIDDVDATLNSLKDENDSN